MFASRGEDPDPIDRAIVEKAKRIPDVMKASNNVTITNFKPFDPVSKRTEASIKRENQEKFKVSKGAPQVILAFTTENNKQLIDQVLEDVDLFAKKGYRAFGLARTDDKDKWRFVGLIGLYDPPREDSAETIKAAQSMGVSVKMVTGDHMAIAKEVAGQVGLGKNIAIPSAFVE
jgi:H+-transporting ATPase